MPTPPASAPPRPGSSSYPTSSSSYMSSSPSTYVDMPQPGPPGTNVNLGPMTRILPAHLHPNPRSIANAIAQLYPMKEIYPNFLGTSDQVTPDVWTPPKAGDMNEKPKE